MGAPFGEGVPRRMVMVVDDVKVNRLILGRTLKALGCDTVYAANGLEAVEQWENSADYFCLLMDINMPYMDGLQATRRIRCLEASRSSSRACSVSDTSAATQPSTSCTTSSSCRRVPIVAVSSCSEAEQLASPALADLKHIDTERPWELVGMDAFLSKPVDKERLQRILHRLTRQKGLRQPSRPSSSSSETLKPARGDGVTKRRFGAISCEDDDACSARVVSRQSYMQSTPVRRCVGQQAASIQLTEELS